jgi:hypothetical protein
MYINMLVNIIRRNIVASAILIFLFFYIMILAMKPAFLYNKDGSLREFGIGYKRKTVIPAWLLAIVIALVSYFSVLYYIN